MVHLDDTNPLGLDKSDATEWASRIERGLVRISTVTRLEVGYSARSAADHGVLLEGPPILSMPVEYLTPRIEDRAVELQSMLAARGQHRAPSIPDLLIAATAALADLTVLHVDSDFELIAEATGVNVERLAVEGTVRLTVQLALAACFNWRWACGVVSSSRVRPSMG